MKLIRKDDHSIAITGTLEQLSGRAGVMGATRNADGSLDLEWEGGTEIYWDEQKTVELNGLRAFIDSNGETVYEDQIDLVEEDEDARD